MAFTLYDLIKATILILNAVAIINHRMLKRLGLERPDPDAPPSGRNRALVLLYGDARHLLQLPLIMCNILLIVFEILLGNRMRQSWHGGAGPAGGALNTHPAVRSAGVAAGPANSHVNTALNVGAAGGAPNRFHFAAAGAAGPMRATDATVADLKADAWNALAALAPPSTTRRALPAPMPLATLYPQLMSATASCSSDAAAAAAGAGAGAGATVRAIATAAPAPAAAAAGAGAAAPRGTAAGAADKKTNAPAHANPNEAMLYFPSAATVGAPPPPPPQHTIAPNPPLKSAAASTATPPNGGAAVAANGNGHSPPAAACAAAAAGAAGSSAELPLPPGTIITTLPSTAAPPVTSLAPASSPKNDKRGSILIICTGGTFAMHRHSDGVLRPTVNALEAMLRSLDELKHPDIPTFDLVEWAEPMDSSDFSPACWVQLAHQIEQNYYAYDGFVILHGTDTMSYTASALSFMLENLAKTVVLTGAMTPLEAPISDAKRNLIISMFVAANSEIPEVLIFFDSVLLRGNRAKKIDPWVTAAFQSPNLEPLGEMGVKVSFRRNIFLPSPRGRFRIHTQLFSNIAVMLMIPGFDDTVIQSFVSGSKGRCAIVLCLYGAGNAPTKKKDFLDVIRYSREVKHAVIVITSQCLRGSVDMTQYATGIQLSQMGVIDGKDMTTEACVTKLAYLMGRGLTGNALKVAMESNLRGELTFAEKRGYAKQAETDFVSKL